MTTTMIRPVGRADAHSPAANLSGIPFRRLLRVEWGKATDTRAARWLLALVGASTVGLMLAPLLGPSSIDQTYTSYLGFASTPLSILLPVVAILTLTSEWSQRTSLTTFTQEPRRLRVVNAKMTVSLIMGGVAAVFGGLVTAVGLGVAAVSGRALDADLNAGVVVGFVLFVLLNVFMGVALGALIHNSAAAIVASFVLPTAFVALGQASTLVGEWFDPSTTLEWLLNGEWSGHTPQILVSVIVWVALPLAMGLVRTVRREIK
jgi:ABC-type transport system involved in multi-copper enzyme maturation permease subunit